MREYGQLDLVYLIILDFLEKRHVDTYESCINNLIIYNKILIDV